MWAALFLLMFFSLLAAGMPIFLVLGVSASILFFVIAYKCYRRGKASDRYGGPPSGGTFGELDGYNLRRRVTRPADRGRAS